MKVLVHDYSGHPFQAQLSGELARRGHDVTHVYCSSYVSGKGRLERRADDPPLLTFVGLSLDRSFDKYSFGRRLVQERSYAKQFVAHVDVDPPEVVVMCNVPLVAHRMIKGELMARGIPTIFWHQDVYSHAIGAEARRRLGPLGVLVGRQADRTEAWIARNARAVVAISGQFLPVHQRWGTDRTKIHVIPNWGPVDDIKPRPRDNDWAREQCLVGMPVMLYSGTLGLKHDAQQLLALLDGVRRRVPDVRLVVVSDGPAADRLRESAHAGLKVLPFQPFERLADVLGSGDVLITILEPEASEYSVPSKTLTYMCAGRPIVALLPRTNPAFEVVEAAGGLAADPAETDIESLSDQVGALLSNRAELDRRGRQARTTAEASFAIGPIADRFEAVLGLRERESGRAVPAVLASDTSQEASA